MKIAFYQMRPFDEQAYIEQFSKEFGIDYVMIPGAPCPENLDKAAGCDAVSQNPCEILPEYVEAWAQMGVKYLLCRSIGYDHLPLETAKKLGMRVAHSHYPPEGVANYAIMLMLMCTRKMNQTMLRAAAQDYTLPGKMGRDLSNCTVGIIGTGKIGRVFAEICRGFGMQVLAYDKFPAADSGLRYAELPELFAEADVVSLHCPLTDETRHMISAEAIRQMKPGVTIVNTSRGALVDTGALIEGLRSRKIGAACLDVYEEEGDLFYEDRSEAIIEDDTLVRLIAMPNVIVTSHQAFLTKEALDNIAATTVENLLKFERGEPSPETEVCWR